MAKIRIETGDLTEKHVDAIVNAANCDLQLGGGLAGAIRRAGGPNVQAECDRHGPVTVGEAAITAAGDLPARYIIHQASMRMGEQTTPDALRDSTHAVLQIAANAQDIRTLAFPATGTGIAGFPPDEAAEIMIGEVLDHLREHEHSLEEITFVLFDDRARDIFQKTLDRLQNR